MEYVTKEVTEFHKVEEIYNSRMKRDFARTELKPLVSIRLLWKRNAYDVYFLTAGDTVFGYAWGSSSQKSYTESLQFPE